MGPFKLAVTSDIFAATLTELGVVGSALRPCCARGRPRTNVKAECSVRAGGAGREGPGHQRAAWEPRPLSWVHSKRGPTLTACEYPVSRPYSPPSCQFRSLSPGSRPCPARPSSRALGDGLNERPPQRGMCILIANVSNESNFYSPSVNSVTEI